MSPYPVKKKGQPRRLDPNWDAINWLEYETETDTEIAEEYDIEDFSCGTGSGLKIQRALGWSSARRRGMYPWPMFQTFPADSFKARMVARRPCPACDDWSRTSKCEEHHDRDGVAGLKVGGERRTGSIAELINVYEQVIILSAAGPARDPLLDSAEPVRFSATLTLEITGDTVQASASPLRIEVRRPYEGAARDDR